MYGLDGPESDYDHKGVFLEARCGGGSLRVGIHESFSVGDQKHTLLLCDFGYYMSNLQRANPSAVELLFADGFDVLEPEFKLVRDNRNRLLDRDVFLNSSLKYIDREIRAATAIRTMSKAKRDHFAKFGFCPKPFSHVLRISRCVEEFFKTGFYPVCLNGDPAKDLIMSVKYEPEKFDFEQLIKLAESAKERLVKTHSESKINFIFDREFARKLVDDFCVP